MKSIYLITMWSGGKPSRKWKSAEKPEHLPQGTGVRFTNLATKLTVEAIGAISVEEFEQGSIAWKRATGEEEADDSSEEKPWKPPFEF